MKQIWSYKKIPLFTLIIVTCFSLFLWQTARAVEEDADVYSDTDYSDYSTGEDGTSGTACDNPQTAEERKTCDAEQLKKEQEALAKIRQDQDITKAKEDCQAEYQTEEAQSVAAGQYVPVHETGDLLTISQSTNQHTVKIEGLNLLLCMYLHAVKRVQYAFEDLAYIKEPDMRRQAATKIEEYRSGKQGDTGVLGKKGFIQTGYTPSGELEQSSGTPGTAGGAPLYPKNIETYQEQAAEEGKGIANDDITQSNNAFKNEVEAQLSDDQNKNYLDSSMERTAFDNMVAGNTSSMSNDEWKQNFALMFDPESPNNPVTAYLLAKEHQQQLVARKVGTAMTELTTGDGFLPTRKCVETTSDGKYCKVWENDTPGKVVQQTVSDALATKLKQYENPQMGQVANGNEPVVSEVQTMEPSIGNGGGSSGVSSDDDFGYESGGNSDIDWGDISDLLSPGDSSGGGSDSGGDGDSVNPPTVGLWVNNIGSSTRVITWVTANASKCTAYNTWIGSQDSNTHLVTVLKSKGQTITPVASGQIVYYRPLTFKVDWSENGGSYSTDSLAIETSSDGNSIIYTWKPPKPSSKTDTYTLRIKDGDKIEGFTITIGGANSPFEDKKAKYVVQALKDYASINSSLAIYDRYQFTYNTTASTPYITIQVNEEAYSDYQIKCQSSDGGVTKVSTQ